MNFGKEWEEHKAYSKKVNSYYPDIERFHQNALLRYFDSLNTNYLMERKKRFNKINTRSEALAYIEEAGSSFRSCLGELPGGSAVNAVNAVVVRTRDMRDYFIDLVLIEALPGYFLTANFYYPKNTAGPSPAVLFLCGHSVGGKAEGMYVAFCIEAVMSGFCVLTFDPVGQGERKMYDEKELEPIDGLQPVQPDDVHFLLGQQAGIIGESITSYMMQDNIKALDYLLSRKEVDSSATVSVVGNSGGGQMAAFMGAYDRRVGAVVSSCYITELKSMIYHIGAQESEQSLQGFMKKGLDLADLVIAAAPKPYFIGAGLMDFFPIDGTRDAFIEARRIYGLLEKTENLAVYIAPKPHGFWWDTREKALRFLCEHAGKEFIQDNGIDYGRLPSEQELLCLAEGDIRYFNTISLQEILQKKAEKICTAPPVIKDASELKAYGESVRTDLLKVLEVGIESISANIERVTRDDERDCNVLSTHYSFYSEEYMKINGILFERGHGAASSVLLHIGGLDIRDEALRNSLEEFSHVFCVEPRGTGLGAVEPGSFFYEPSRFENEEASYNCNAAMLGKNMAGLKVIDVLAAAKLLKGIKNFENCPMTIAGEGENALIALYTAVALQGRDVRLKNLLYSFKSIIENRVYLWNPSVLVYGILRHLDISDLLAALSFNSVRVEGFLDHSKKKADMGKLQEMIRRLRTLGAIAGNYPEIS